MKPFLKASAAVAIFVASFNFASADTLQLGSFATAASSMGNANTAMNFAGYSAVSTTPAGGTGTSYLIAPGTTWAVPGATSTWVGYAATAGPVGTSNPAFGYYTFTTNFTSGASGSYSGSLSLMADDTAEVFLNGVMLMPFAALGSDLHCADGAPTCLVSDTISLNGASLLSGPNANTLTFVVQQAGLGPTGGTGDPTGVDFQGTLSNVPEPSTLLLLATGVLAFASLMVRRGVLVLAARRTCNRFETRDAGRPGQ